jgi:hypothetical protein
MMGSLSRGWIFARFELGPIRVDPVVVNIGFMEVGDMHEHPCKKLHGIDDW